ncbi:MaoC family dehydratase [uncultured Paracoccus sp.]|uniref:MaoC family dehydratase n=1 Tax=uncultured Paracoccus sp. TaxID=189685 RepID=UPI002626F936|nr:MaoC family dehydratase [uncultured Paracoccus sp.]
MTVPRHLFDDIGAELGVSRWFLIDQTRIDAFAAATDDRQFIHVDPDAAAGTPFGGTIAHGFLTLSMLSPMLQDAVPDMPGQVMGVNYGIERLRLISPVRAGSRVRGRFTLAAAEERHPGEVTMTLDTVVEIQAQDRPALICSWINRRYFAPSDPATAPPRHRTQTVATDAAKP